MYLIKKGNTYYNTNSILKIEIADCTVVITFTHDCICKTFDCAHDAHMFVMNMPNVYIVEF